MSADPTLRWLALIQKGSDDAALARFLLQDLTHYRTGGAFETNDMIKVLSLITAIRLREQGAVVA